MRSARTLLAGLLVAAVGGCSTGNPSALPATRPQSVSRTVVTIRVASGLATKAALVAADEREVIATARGINAVAVAVGQAADDPVLAIGFVKGRATKFIAGQAGLTLKQRLIASQLLDTIVVLVQGELENDDGSYRDVEVIRQMVKSAAAGVIDATAVLAAE